MNISDGAHKLIWPKRAGVKLDPSMTPITTATIGLSFVGPATGKRINAAMMLTNIAPSIQGNGNAAKLKIKPDAVPKKSAKKIFTIRRSSDFFFLV